MKLLMVCLGNICRSPIAEGVMQAIIIEQNLPWTVGSAGTNGYHNGEAPHKYSQKVCKQHGIDISQQRSRQFNTEDFDQYDHILVMASDVYDDVMSLARSTQDREKVSFFLDALYPQQQKAVPDPWYGDASGYLPVYQSIEAGCQALATQLTKV